MDYQAIIDRYYPEDNELRRLLMKHSRDVADKALAICDRHPELGLDRDFIEAAAMLHDIGIRECDAPGIFCFGHRNCRTPQNSHPKAFNKIRNFG